MVFRDEAGNPKREKRSFQGFIEFKPEKLESRRRSWLRKKKREQKLSVTEVFFFLL